MNKKQKEKFREFIFDNLDHILKASDFGAWRSQVNIHDDYAKDEDGKMIEFEIDPDPPYQQFRLDIYKTVQDYYEAGQFNRVYEGLCHEVGHLHTATLYGLLEQTYKSKEEVIRANENLSTKIGYYLYKLSITGDETSGNKRKRTK
ncbi:MAG: hypothetical protein ACOC80_15995 [Petrotogales bacterium]